MRVGGDGQRVGKRGMPAIMSTLNIFHKKIYKENKTKNFKNIKSRLTFIKFSTMFSPYADQGVVWKEMGLIRDQLTQL